MRGTLNIPMSSLVPSKGEGILSLCVYVLNLHNVSGAVDIVVKKICMGLAFLKTSGWWKKHITSPRSVINGNIKDPMGVDVKG